MAGLGKLWGQFTSASPAPVTDAASVNIDADIGSPSDATPVSETGSNTLIGLTKLVANRVGAAVAHLATLIGMTPTKTVGGSMPVKLAEGVQRTAAVVTVSVAGAVPSGAVSVAFSNIGASVAYVQGEALPSGASIGFEATAPDTLGPFTYDGTGTQLMVATLV